MVSDIQNNETLGLTPDQLRHRREPATSGAAMEQAGRFAIEAARLIAELHCEDVIVFDVRGLSQLTDYLLIASGTSDRQIKAVAGHVTELGKEMGVERFGTDLDDAATWVVVDFVEVMVHLFEPTRRAHYDLEMMWGDAPRVTWQRGKEGRS